MTVVEITRPAAIVETAVTTVQQVAVAHPGVQGPPGNGGDGPTATQLFVQQSAPTFTNGTVAQWWELNPDGTLKTLWIFDGTP